MPCISTALSPDRLGHRRWSVHDLGNVWRTLNLSERVDWEGIEPLVTLLNGCCPIDLRSVTWCDCYMHAKEELSVTVDRGRSHEYWHRGGRTQLDMSTRIITEHPYRCRSSTGIHVIRYLCNSRKTREQHDLEQKQTGLVLTARLMI